MTNYHRITFAPVQGFIQKSRKLRDLDGSSLILSFLAASICQPYQPDREDRSVLLATDRLVLPATIDIARGVPNQIVIKGDVSEKDIRKSFNNAWSAIVKTCQHYIESQLPKTEFDWNREWNYCCKYSWELFYACDTDFESAKNAIASRKQARNWVGINWTGESSSLSGADAIAWNQMCSHKPTDSTPRAKIDEFYKELTAALPDSIIDEKERLSIPELIKRLITLQGVRDLLRKKRPNLPDIQKLDTFRDLNRLKPSSLSRNHSDLPDIEGVETLGDLNGLDLDREKLKPSRWTGWFMGDGDRAGTYLDWKRVGAEDPDAKIYDFSRSMATWSKGLQYRLPIVPHIRQDGQIVYPQIEYDGRIVYAGGDDFLGVLYRNAPYSTLQLSECFEWLWYCFPEIWRSHGQQELTVSVGFVWAAPRIPQRDLLQHCRLAEKSAKSAGRDRLAVRILFNNGNHLEWCCPWWCLEKVLSSYRDREGGKNWTHFHDDIVKLDSRHSISDRSSEIAIAIFKIYFKEKKEEKEEKEEIWSEISTYLWNSEEPEDENINYFSLDHTPAGILGKKPPDLTEEIANKRINDWIVALSKVGFHIFADWS